MADTETLDLLIEGGKAKPGPATAPKLGALKVNMGQLFQDINEKTKDYAGMNVPVKVIINKKDHSYEIKIGTPPVSSLLRKELGLKKIAGETKTEEPENGEEKAKEGEKKENEKVDKKDEKKEGEEETEEKKTKKEEKREKAEKARKDKEKEKVREIVADVKMEQCVRVAKMKRDSLLAKTFKSAVKEVVGSCVSMPVTVEGKTPKETLKDIDEGKYDSVLKEE